MGWFSIVPGATAGAQPVYNNTNGQHMYFSVVTGTDVGRWMIGTEYTDSAHGVRTSQAMILGSCPADASGWEAFISPTAGYAIGIVTVRCGESNLL